MCMSHTTNGMQATITARERVFEVASVTTMTSCHCRPQCNRSNLERQDHKGSSMLQWLLENRKTAKELFDRLWLKLLKR